MVDGGPWFLALACASLVASDVEVLLKRPGGGVRSDKGAWVGCGSGV